MVKGHKPGSSETFFMTRGGFILKFIFHAVGSQGSWSGLLSFYLLHGVLSSNFSFVACAFCVIAKKPLLNPRSKIYTYVSFLLLKILFIYL